MADFKTTLREVSVAVKIYDLTTAKQNIDYTLSPSNYYEFCKLLSLTYDQQITSISSLTNFSADEKTIIQNSFKLADYIYLKLGHLFSNTPKILWHGWDTQKMNLMI